MSSWAPRRRATTVTATAIAVPAAVFLAWLLLAPQTLERRLPEAVAGAQDWIAATLGPGFATLGAMDAAANAMVFLLVGVLAYLIIPRDAWLLALLVAPAISVAVEVAQVFLLPQRVADLNDVLAATIGGTLGIAIAATCTALTARRRTNVATTRH